VRMQGPDGPYWAISNVTIPLGAFLTFFKVTIPEPGEYTVVLTLQSPDLYDKEDHRYEDTFVARARRSWSDLRRLFHDSAVNVLDHDFCGIRRLLHAAMEAHSRCGDHGGLALTDRRISHLHSVMSTVMMSDFCSISRSSRRASSFSG
jgi:hypothetical protein